MLRHVLNWRASERNRPHFPRVAHTNGRYLDVVNNLYEDVFGELKHRYWGNSDEVVMTKSPFGIVSLGDVNSAAGATTTMKGLPRSLAYLARRQGSTIPFTPVKTKEEKGLFATLVRRALMDNNTISSATTFESMVAWWNGYAKGTNGIYKKHAEHLTAHYKSWKKNNSRRTAVKDAGTAVLIKAV